ncbi:Putative ankyrin repeat protein RF_0381, partial [Durusdinium trenchii]
MEPSCEDVGAPTDLSAAEAGIAAAEAADEEDWDEEEVEEEERTTDGLVDPLQDEKMAPLGPTKEEARRRKRLQDFWPDSDEDDESYAPGREEEDDDDDAGMRQFMEGNRWAFRHEAWPTMLKSLKESPETAAPLVELLRTQLCGRSWQLRKLDALRRSMLHLALMRHRPDLVRAILCVEDQDEVAHILTKPFEAAGDSDKDLIPCLHLALCGVRSKDASDSLQCLQLLLDQAPNLVTQVDNSGRSGLHLACALGSAPAVELLMANGADAGLQDDFGFMPLHYAIDSRNLESVKLMVEVSDRSAFPGELSPFYRCIDRSMWEAALLLHKHGWPMSEAEIPLLFDFAAARGLGKEWNFVAEFFLAPEGVDNASLEEVTWPEIFKDTNTVLVTHPMCGRHGHLPEEADDPQLRHELMGRIPENPHR